MATTLKTFNTASRRFETAVIPDTSAPLAAASAPTVTVDDSSITSTFYGGNTSALGTPTGWAETTVNGATVLVPYYTP